MPSVIAYHVTAHGYGHGVRSCDILKALYAARPDLDLLVISDLAPQFFTNRLDPHSITLIPGSFDAGMVQLDSIRVDMDASLGKVIELCRRREELRTRGAGLLRCRNASCVVSDIPAIPLEAASQLGIPAIAVGNFGWDWIYSDYVVRDSRWEEGARIFAEGYATADLLLRLPFSEPMTAFRKIEDVPVVASPGRERRREIAAICGCDPGRKWVLLSFATLEWPKEAVVRVGGLADYEFFTVRPLQWEGTRLHALDRGDFSFADIVASVDCVVSKPGFGIISDCVANQKPLVFAERSDFPEYGVLENAIRRYLRNVLIPAGRLYAGDLGDSLEAIWSAPDPVASVPLGGAALAARRILDFVS